MSLLLWIWLAAVTGVAWADARIDTHLARIEATLRSAPAPDPLRAEARERNLDALRVYRAVGRFPHNSGGPLAAGRPPAGGYHERPGENPVFIDDAGIPCAVGWLLVASGHGDIAEVIRATDNRSRLADIHLAALDAWIETSGLSALELARIQPSYELQPWPAYEGTCNSGELEGSLFRMNSGGGSLTSHPWNRAAPQAATTMPAPFRDCLIRRIAAASDAHEERAAATLLMALELGRSPPPNGRVEASWEPAWRPLLAREGYRWQNDESTYIQYLYDGERFADLIARVDERLPAMRGGGPVVLTFQLARILAVAELVRRQAEPEWRPRVDVIAGVVGVVAPSGSVETDVAEEFREALSALVLGDRETQEACATWKDPLPADKIRVERVSIDLRVEGRVVAAVTPTEPSGAMPASVACLVGGIVGQPMTAVRDDIYRMSVSLRQRPDWSYRSYPLDPG